MADKKLTWRTEKRKIGELIPYEKNPRRLTEKQYNDLKNSLSKFNLAEIPAVNTDNTIIAGHQRLKILAELYGKDYEIDVRVPSRKLTKKELQEYNIRSNKNSGEWDFDILANEFELEDLLDWGFEDHELDITDSGGLDGENIFDLPKSVQVEPPKEYILILAEPNSEEWEELKERLKLKLVRRGGYKKGSPFDKAGLERVLYYKDFKERFKDDNSSTK